MTWLILLLSLTALVALGYYLLVTTEGVFLGKRVVIWLYDLTAHKYDDIKGFDPLDERFSVARPIVNGLANPHGKVLDVATGTGRVPVALASDPAFHGLVVGLDPSRKMLDQAARKLAGRQGRVFSYDIRLCRCPSPMQSLTPSPAWRRWNFCPPLRQPWPRWSASCDPVAF
jgi:hypothetical protein